MNYLLLFFVPRVHVLQSQNAAPEIGGMKEQERHHTTSAGKY
jgi:hypothetical protein